MLTVKEFCDVMRIHSNTAYKWIKSGKIKCVKIGNVLRIPDEEIERLKRGECDESEN